MLILEKEKIANFILEHSGFNSNRDFLQVIKDLSCIQVDPINIVSRSHEIALYNRSTNFKKNDLYKALYEDHLLFEYWFQLYSIIPIEAFPYLHSLNRIPGDRQREISNDWHNDYRNQHKKQIDALLKHITECGPTSSREIQHLPKAAAIHSWKGEASQIALLEFLWNTGEIQICYRESNTKYYDLTERVLPADLLKIKIDPENVYRFILDSNFKYWGLMRTNRLNRSGRNRAQGVRNEFRKQLKSGEIVEIKIKEARQNLKYFIKQNDLAKLVKITENPHHTLNILSPLDPMIMDRELMVDIFDFFYRWEAYTPLKKRKYGYYNMPILYHGKLVGQIDLVRKLDIKGNKELEVKSLHLNDKSKTILKDLKIELERFREFCWN